MTETGAPDGFAYSEDITFTVNEDGTVDKVVMQDKKTHVSVSKTDITTGNELPGAHLIIKDKNGNTVAEWTSTDKPYELVGILKAGESYTLIEEGRICVCRGDQLYSQQGRFHRPCHHGR